MYDFRANIAILLNITPDHLDRYDFKFENYADAKMRITQNQTPDDAFIYWNDDPVINKELKKFDIHATLYPFSELKEAGSIAYIEEGKYTIEKPTPFNMEQKSSVSPKAQPLQQSGSGFGIQYRRIKKESIRKSPATSQVLSTVWRKCARYVACSMSTTPRRRMSMPAGMLSKA